jgi:peptide/nickel transport system permease protein
MSQDISRENEGIARRIADNPRPALLWLLGALVLLALEFGALAEFVVSYLPGTQALSIPTLLSRELIPNQGHRVASGGWTSTFLGLAPAYAWAVRVVLVYVYAFCWLAWFWVAYLTFRRNYRFADWTPTDDMIDRMRDHQWGQFGFIMVAIFVVAAVFAPTLAPFALDANIVNPYSHQTTYLNQQTGEVMSVTVGQANILSQSVGIPQQNVGLLQYDQYGRFHPLGTTAAGQDVFTFMVYGARIALFIGIFATGLAFVIAIVLSMLTAYYKGVADLAAVVASDGVASLPLLLLLIMATVVFGGTWLDQLYHGAVLLALFIGLFYWPYFWRTVRGPAYQTVENEWVDAARSYGQRPFTLMRKHVAPFVIGYLLIYASLAVGGIIISVAALSFLGVGLTAPTPSWGRLVALGQQYVPTASWHISIVPGVAILLLVMGLNALGDGIRDAIDPEETGESEEAAVAAGGGG